MWPWVLGVAVLAGAITFFVSSRQAKVYRATARLLSVQAGDVSGFNGLNVGLPTIQGLDSKAYQAAATSNEVFARLLERLQEVARPYTRYGYGRKKERGKWADTVKR